MSEMGYKEGFRDGLSHAAEIIWPTGNTTNVETITLIKASGIIRKEMLSEALAGFKPDAKRFRTAFEMAESFSDYLNEIDQLKERLAIKDDVICASRLVIEEYERKLKQLRTETSISVIKDTITEMLKEYKHE